MTVQSVVIKQKQQCLEGDHKQYLLKCKTKEEVGFREFIILGNLTNPHDDRHLKNKRQTVIQASKENNLETHL